MHVVLLGCPRPVGGANVEAGHTALLWRRFGMDVTIVPTWQEDVDNPWLARLRDHGCKIVESRADDLQSVPGLAGGIVVSFCNSKALDAWPTLQALGCRVVWSPCMCYTTPLERKAFRQAPPAAVHFQSQYQHDELVPQFHHWGLPADRRYLIHGAFDALEFPFCPSSRHRRFTVGRLARAVATKWPKNLFEILHAVRNHRVDVHGIFMGWSHEIERKCGKPPSWAMCIDEDAIRTATFLGDCDAILCLNGGDDENWPRVGLEAMAAGVPIVAERRFGWPEMLVDGETGLLCETPAEFIEALVRLATNEPLRLSIAHSARAAVERLADPELIGQQWLKLFADLGA